MKKIYISALLFMISLLFFAGCSRTVEQQDTLAVTAAFAREDSAPLSGHTVRLSQGEDSEDYQLDSEGTLRASGLPRSGEMRLTLLDQRQEVQGAMTLSFDQGAVTDAATGQDGVGHITVRNDADEVSLVFTLEDNGALACSLRLQQAEGSGS